MLTQLEQNRRIIHDFVEVSLASISTQFGRLIYLASLRDLSSGKYEHAGLQATYPAEAMQQALQQCHEEIFERILETSLERQEEDLRMCLSAMDTGLRVSVQHWKRLETYRVLIPEHAPEYLKDLFCSNLQALLEAILEGDSENR